jgi:5-formyltetrahydrofolate cyclo-ligase
LREAALKLRKVYDPDEKRQNERDIYCRLFSSELMSSVDNILCYVSMPEEVSTDNILKLLFRRSCGTKIDESPQQSVRVFTLASALAPNGMRKVAVPRVSGDVMDFYVIHSPNDLEPGHFGIFEPKAHCELFRSFHNTICITPALIFTEDGHRLGYGKGFYDRFFEEHPEVLKIGIAFEKNIYPKGFMKTDKFDIPVDIIFTERRVIDVRK